MKRLFFFGCGNQEKGHYLMSSDDGPIGNTDRVADEMNISRGLIRAIDGTLCPGGPERQGVYRVTRSGKIIIVSWWDRTGDPRPASNSNLIGYGYNSPGEMITDARIKFPITMARQTILEPEP